MKEPSLVPHGMLRFCEPARYKVVVFGQLWINNADLFGGFDITPVQIGGDVSVTVLSGEVRDQAELAGLLNNLYELRLPIVEVKWIKASNP